MVGKYESNQPIEFIDIVKAKFSPRRPCAAVYTYIHAFASLAKLLSRWNKVVDKEHVGPRILITLSNKRRPTGPKRPIAPRDSKFPPN